jgi:hypothetical protein
MRKWLIAGGCVAVVAGGLWLALRSQQPTPRRSAVRPGRVLAPGSARRDYPMPGQPASGPATTAEGPSGVTIRVRPHPGKSLVPQFDPFLDQLTQAAEAGNLEKAAAENGVRLKGDQVRVVIRPTLGGGDKVREAVLALGGEVARSIDRGSSEPTLVAWVPAKSLRKLAENDSVRNLHRPVGLHANEAPEKKPARPGAPAPEAPPEAPPP